MGFKVIFSFLKPNFIDNKIEYVKALIPVIDGRYWYPVSYILLFFLIPFLNVVINKLDKKDLECMIKILFIFFCITSVFGLYDFFKIYNRYSPVWLIYLYILGGILNCTIFLE